MDDLVKADLYRYFGKNNRRTFFRGLQIPGFRFSCILRMCAKYKKFTLPGLFYRLLYRRYKYKYGYQIPIHTSIGKGLYLGHFGLIVINGKAVIGNNCNIEHGVTIGQSNRGKHKGNPVIGNSVWIGAGSVIVGNVHIGDNVLIAPNSYINTDIPANSMVINTNSISVVSKQNAVEGYINFPVM